MSFIIYNSLTQKKEVFKPIKPPYVKMYCCGPTVYDFLHIGNFRGAVCFNFLRQWLEHKKYKVTYVYNFTDVDNKILNKAQKENKTMKQIADQYIAEFKTDFTELKLKKHDHNPQATQFIPDIIKLIETLLQKKIAYTINKDVFYNVKSFPNYGNLSKRKASNLSNISRIKIDKRKKDSRDFALWKTCPTQEPGWDTPWGYGRPGWHIECTSMIFSLLGESIDIHGGGSDLLFPHHENELAQAEGASQKPFVKYWMHNNMFTFSGEKMSKSLGNVSIMRDFLKKYNGEVFKYLVLSSHYRSVTEVSDSKILQCIQSLSRIYDFLKRADSLNADNLTSSQVKNTNTDFLKRADSLNADNLTSSQVKNTNTNFLKEITLSENKIEAALNDDLNTPVFLSIIYTLIRKFNYQIANLSVQQQALYSYNIKNLILKYGKMMSLFQENPTLFLQRLNNIFIKTNTLDEQKILDLIKQRSQAKQEKDFKTADKIREQLLDMNIELKDSANGTTWNIKKNY